MLPMARLSVSPSRPIVDENPGILLVFGSRRYIHVQARRDVHIVLSVTAVKSSEWDWPPHNGRLRSLPATWL